MRKPSKYPVDKNGRISTSMKMKKELYKAAMIYAVNKEIDLQEIMEIALAKEIGFKL